MSSWRSLDPEDDLLHMERSTLATFCGQEQKSVLLELWDRLERASDMEFLRKMDPYGIRGLTVLEDTVILDVEEEGAN